MIFHQKLLDTRDRKTVDERIEGKKIMDLDVKTGKMREYQLSGVTIMVKCLFTEIVDNIFIHYPLQHN